ncbi:unnamed protein product [Peronospora belbahrii]|uniref:Uncharacterized protein n=1 Tax=Peronospora belbahrii TaxID=622444 RepID=A0AAU9L557_9STRA|nr:unnamed protein product [Peronospora belbahrii]
MQFLGEKTQDHFVTRRGEFRLSESLHEGMRIRRPSSSAVTWTLNHHSPLFASPSTNIPDRYPTYQIDKASPQLPLDVWSRVRPAPIETSSCYITQEQTQRNPFNSSPFRLSHDHAGRRQLYHYNVDPCKIHVPTETTGTRHIYHQGLCRKHRRSDKVHRHLSPSHVGFMDRHAEEIDMSVKKRRRVVTPTPLPCQPLYEPEYGMTVLKTSRSLEGSSYVPNIKSDTEGSVSAPGLRYIRGNLREMKKVELPSMVGPRITYSDENEGVCSKTAFATGKKKTVAPARRKQTCVKNCEAFAITTLAVKFKELLKSNSVVRTRHDEIDWLAMFLKIGFEPSSIYALMCPLRKGRWKLEEESYTMGLLRLIERGTILLRHGQSIRGYIGEKLHSDDMRVLKKLSNCNMFHFAKLINPRLAEEEKVDMSIVGAREELERLEQLKGDFLRSVQLEALVAVRKHLSDSSLRDLVSMRR